MSALRQPWIHLQRLSPVNSLIATLLRNFLQKLRSLDISLQCAPCMHTCYLGELSQWSPGWVVHQSEPTLKYSCLLPVYWERQRFVLHDIPGTEEDLARKNLFAAHKSSGAGRTGK